MDDDDRNDEELSTIETRPNEPSLGSQPSLRSKDLSDEIGGNCDDTGKSHISMVSDM